MQNAQSYGLKNTNYSLIYILSSHSKSIYMCHQASPVVCLKRTSFSSTARHICEAVCVLRRLSASVIWTQQLYPRYFQHCLLQPRRVFLHPQPFATKFCSHRCVNSNYAAKSCKGLYESLSFGRRYIVLTFLGMLDARLGPNISFKYAILGIPMR